MIWRRFQRYLHSSYLQMIQTFTMNHPIYLISKKTVNKELRKVRKWLEANRLALNIDKTNFVIFHSPQNIPNDWVIIKFGRKKVNQETCVKFLGVLLDSLLSWKPHITELSKKLSRTVGLFYKIRHYAPLETLKLLYYRIFFPFI